MASRGGRGAGSEGQGNLGGTEGEQRQRSTGRKDREGTEEVPNFPTIKAGIKEMMRSYKKLEQAREAYNEIAKKLAERGHVNAANLKKLVRASVSGNFPDHRRLVDQQSALFEVVGEVSEGPSPE